MNATPSTCVLALSEGFVIFSALATIHFGISGTGGLVYGYVVSVHKYKHAKIIFFDNIYVHMTARSRESCSLVCDFSAETSA